MPTSECPPVFAEGCTYLEVRRHLVEGQILFSASLVRWRGQTSFVDTSCQGVSSRSPLAAALSMVRGAFVLDSDLTQQEYW